MGRHPIPFERRFWDKVQKGDGCWIWTAANTSEGYGKFGIGGGKLKQATHVAWYLTHGRWPEFLCHSCDNPPCVNPAHLFEGNAALNAADRENKNRGGKWAGQRARGEQIKGSKLTTETVLRIRAIRESTGDPVAKIAQMFGIHENTARDVINRKTWDHV